jgi:hypothetical protein
MFHLLSGLSILDIRIKFFGKVDLKIIESFSSLPSSI